MYVYKKAKKNMKLFKQSSITLWLLILLPVVTFGNNVTGVKDIFHAINYIKETINFENITIKSTVPYTEIQNAIQKFCPKTAVEQAKKEIIPLKEVWSSYLNMSGINQSLSDRFNLVKWLISEQKQNNEYKFCKDSYLFFSILKTTQDLYTWEKDSKNSKIVVNQEKITTTNNIQTSARQVKTGSSTNIHGVAQSKISFNFIHDISWLPNDAKNVFKETTERYLQEIIANLVDIRILDENDLKIMNNKIKVTYQQNCQITEWAFRVLRNKQTWNYTFKEIELVISYCDKNNTAERQKRHVQQILSHELWHYIYFFKDKNPSKFSEICWDNGKINCLPQEFVSNYAKKSQEEDYAESFAYWYLYNTDGTDWSNNHWAAPDNPINKRARYFEDLFEKEENDDDGEDDDK